ncbi:hypothetical protein CC80DRAFT_490671 [Byssothecium circinans]|uniref:SWR1-complex protein 3 domain-containing protein n=1 Tax=Byssothecium circinans TaxID=147558 RepID=A0A6A5U7N9_9PLEO|nr:hypothetical protein CC80DRAFT_490671 [Byssothecium circinans]
MSEPRRSTRARAREEAAPAPPEAPKEAPKPKSQSLKRKRSAAAAKDARTTPSLDAANPDQPPKQVLPLRLVDGQPLPTLSEPQPLDLPAREYQDIQHSGVLSASFKQSRAVWTSGVNFRIFHALFTPPKKVADRSEDDKQKLVNQKNIAKDFPLVGEAQLVIEPHTFTIRLYAPKEAELRHPIRPVQKKTSTYGQWGNHNQPGTYQYNRPQPPQQPMPLQRPPQPKQQPQPMKAPPPAPHAPQNPAPDPVIHMLAQRAGQDPDLKAVMKIVAAGQATKDQLEFFQGHISELTQILERQKKEAAKAPQPQPPPPAPKPVVAPPPQSQPQPLAAPQPPTQPQSQPHLQHQSAPKYHNAPPPQAHQPQMAPPPPQQPPYNNSYNNPPYNQPPPQQYHQPQHAPQHASQPTPTSRPTSYRPLQFDFVEGNGDKYHFPSYSFMEWLPGMQGAKFSFLITRLKPNTQPKPEETAKVSPTPASTVNPAPPPITPSTAPPNAPAMNGNQMPGTFTLAPTPVQTPTPAAPPAPTTPRVEDYDEREHLKDIDFYQPVTVLVLSNKPDILHAFSRAVRPPDVVEKYMNEVFDTARRAEETYLAFRLPKEGGGDVEMKSGNATPAVSTPTTDVIMGGMEATADKKRKTAGRPRRSLVA